MLQSARNDTTVQTKLVAARLVVLVLSIGAQLCAGAYVALSLESLTVSAEIADQVPWLLAMSILGSVSLLFNIHAFGRFVVLFSRFVIAFIIGYAMESRFGSELLLIISILFEGSFYLGPLTTAVFSMSAAASFSILRSPEIAWGQLIKGPATADRLLFLVLVGTVTFLVIRWNSLSIIRRTKDQQIERLDNVVRQLTSANVRFQDQALSAENQATAEERNRISRDIHDTVGYTLTNIIMMTRYAERIAGDHARQLKEILSGIRKQCQTGLGDIRYALRQIRSTRIERAVGYRAIARMVAEFERATNVRVNINFTNATWPQGGAIDEAVFHIVQEGLTNAFRHGEATEVQLTFWCENGGLNITIEDNGKGSDQYEVGIGLEGMRERLEKHAGSLVAANRAGGFTLKAEMRIDSDDELK
jgi:signal transduction histidine kinase